MRPALLAFVVSCAGVLYLMGCGMCAGTVAEVRLWHPVWLAASGLGAAAVLMAIRLWATPCPSCAQKAAEVAKLTAALKETRP